jgi:high mobility group protein B1
LAVKSKGAEKPAKGRKGKAGKDPNKPKRAPSAFFVFMSDPSSLPLFFLFFFEKSWFLFGCGGLIYFWLYIREEFRKEFKEKNPKNKSVAEVSC